VSLGALTAQLLERLHRGSTREELEKTKSEVRKGPNVSFATCGLLGVDHKFPFDCSVGPGSLELKSEIFM
jgi:hypothetical protein